jgi:Homeodomain-like domain-containing protein
MNVAANRMRSLGCALSQAPRFNSFVVAMRHTLYDQIGDSIGGDAADKLIADFGGRRLYIPRAPERGDLITRSIGLLAALTMARVFGGDRILIPATTTHARRRARIVTLRAEHVSISHIARELRCTERYVYKVLALCRAQEPSISSDCSASLDGRGTIERTIRARQRSAALVLKKTSAPAAERIKRGHVNRRS